jgi:hypothetical protein
MTTSIARISRMLVANERGEAPDVGDVTWVALGVRFAMYTGISLEAALDLPANWRLKVAPRRIEGSAPVEIVPRRD